VGAGGDRDAAGAWVEVDEERLLVCRVGELLGVLEEAKEPVAP
jgi:chaperonin GroES